MTRFRPCSDAFGEIGARRRNSFRWLHRYWCPLLLGFLTGTAAPTSATTVTYGAPGSITIQDGTSGSPYPSVILVTNLPGLLTKVTVTVSNLTHSRVSDVDLLLVGPSGVALVLMSDAGGEIGVTNLTLTFDDAANGFLSAVNLPNPGAYRPTDFSVGSPDAFPAPAPTAPYGTNLAEWEGTNPNGAWQLFVVDDSPGSAGQIAGGWSMTLNCDLNPALAPRPDFWVPDGRVNAFAWLGDTLYLGGRFSSLRPNRGTGVAIDLGSLEADPAFPPVNGEVLAVAGDGAGGFYLGGNFTVVGTQPRSNIAYVDRNRNVTDWNPGVSGTVSALLVADGAVYVGGSFFFAGGANRHHLAALSMTTGLPTPWAPELDSPVTALAKAGRNLYVAGSFTNVGNPPRRYLAAWDTVSGALLPWNPGSVGSVNALTILGDGLFVGGDFTSIGGQIRVGLAALDVHTGLVLPWNPSTGTSSVSVATLAIGGNTLFVGGTFSSVGGQSRQGLCAVDVDSGQLSPWNPASTNPAAVVVSSLTVAGDTVFVAGGFTNLGGAPRNSLAGLDSATGAVRPWSVPTSSQVSSLGISQRTLYAGGAVYSPGAVMRHNLAAIDLRTGRPTSWNPGTDGEVFTLLTRSNRVYVGGEFEHLGGTALRNLGAVNAVSGTPVLDWSPGPNGPVFTLANSPGGASTLYVGGYFTLIGGQLRDNLAGIDAFGLATAWNPSANGLVRTLVPSVDGSDVFYAGGTFTLVGGQSRNRLAAILESAGTSTTWNPDANAVVWSLAVSSEKIFVGGGFSMLGGQSRNHLAAVDPQGVLTSWNPGSSGTVVSLALDGDQVYAAGLFGEIGGAPRSNLASLYASSGAVTPWTPALEWVVSAIAIGSNAVYAGGEFTRSASRYQSRLAVYGSGFAPGIVEPPQSQSIQPGETLALTVAAIGQAPLSYQWQFNGTNIAGALGSTLILPSIPSSGSGNYAAVVTNIFGRVASDAAAITVLQPPVVLVQPASQSVAAGTDVVLSVVASGNPPPQFIWRRNGIVLPKVTSSSLTLRNVGSTNGGRYGVLLVNPAGEVATADAVLRVTNPTAIALNDTVLNNLSPASTLTGEATGDNALATTEPDEPLHAGRTGGKSLWLSWLAPSTGLARLATRGSDFDTLLAVYTGTNVANLLSIASDDDSAGYGASQVAFNAFAGQLYRIAVDGWQGATGHVVLTWTLEAGKSIPLITAGPVSQTVLPGSAATFSVAATGSGPLRYQWFHGRQSIPGATSSTLVIPETQAADLGEYSAFVIDNSCSVISTLPAQLELGSGATYFRDFKLRDTLPRNAAMLAGTSLVQLPELSEGPDDGRANCLPLSNPGAFAPACCDAVLTTNLSRSFDTGSRAPSIVPNCDIVWYPNTAVYADVPGVFVVRTTRAQVLLNAFQGFGEAHLACAASSGPDNLAIIRFPIELGQTNVYSIGPLDPRGGTVEETRVFCTNPAVAGVVMIGSPASPSPLGYADGHLVLQARVLAQDPLCGQTLQWMKGGLPIRNQTNSMLALVDFTLDPASLTNYSLVVSNCAGATNFPVADLLTIWLEPRESQPVYFRAAPRKPVPYRVEYSDDLTTWIPWKTNPPHTLPEIPIELPEPVSLFRVFRVVPVHTP